MSKSKPKRKNIYRILLLPKLSNGRMKSISFLVFSKSRVTAIESAKKELTKIFNDTVLPGELQELKVTKVERIVVDGVLMPEQ